MAKKPKKIAGLKKRRKSLNLQEISRLQKKLQQAVNLHQIGQFRQAEVLYKQILNKDPGHVDALQYLGIVSHQQGKSELAVKYISKAFRLKPDDPDICFHLGIVYQALNNYEKGADCYRCAIRLKPDHMEAQSNLGIILADQGKYDEAVACFNKVISSKPDNAAVHYNLGNVYNEQGMLEKAVKSYQKALSLKPDYPEVHNNLGFIYKQLYKIEDARECFRKALSLRRNYAKAYKGLTSIIKYSEKDEDILAMESFFEKTINDQQPEDRADLGFALGKVFEDLRVYDKSFAYIQEANKVKRKSFEYSIMEERDLFDRIKRTFSAEFFISHINSGTMDSTPIFILGMPRSGTTLVEQIIASHPLVFGAGELKILMNLVDNFCAGEPDKQFPECMVDVSKKDIKRIGSEYILKIRQFSNTAKHITDKLPHNFLRIGLIKAILPNAKVIHCKRNSMDTCFSIYKKDFTGEHTYSYDLVELGQYYNLYLDLMAHWDKVLPGYIYTLEYEKLVSDQVDQTRNLLEFCGLPWDEACLTFYKTERI